MVSVIAGFILISANFIFLVSRYVVALINVRSIVASTNLLYMLFFTVFPALWWAYSTKEDEFNFYNRKNTTLRFVILNDLLMISQAIWSFMFNLAVYRICEHPAGRNFSEEMILNLCRIVLAGSSLGFTAGMYKIADTLLNSTEIKESVETFRWQHIVDDRKNKTRLYDLDIVRRMTDGRRMLIKEVDRFVHMFILGQSGTGKTSSTFTPSIVCDLNRKLLNRIDRQAALKRLLDRKKAHMDPPVFGAGIDEHCVKPNEGSEEEYKAILKKHPDCGITMMAPNNSANKKVISLCKARGITVNVIDPAEDLTEPGVKMKGLNPLYVPPGIDADDRQILISNLAQNFSDVILAVSEIHGSSGDPYFRDINASVTTNVAVICMLDAALRGDQTNIRELQQCIQDFSRLVPKVTQIMNAFKMRIDIKTEDSKKPERKDKQDIAMQSSTLSYIPVTIKDVPDEFKAKGFTEVEYGEYLKKQANNYYPSIYFVLTELLGTGYAKMFDQARGLRNIINNLLLDPRIANLLCADVDSMLDFDRMLSHNEITVINTALEFGPQSSTALGVFIMLNMKLAVMRRARIPEPERSNHFLYIDEASQYMHPMYEDMFALFRQYRVAVTLALQSLSQMDKTPTTRYLKGVIMGAGIHMVFGRANSEEMKYYEQMAGMENREIIQQQVNSNSEFDENYSVTKGERTSLQEEASLKASQIRVRDFQEVSMFMIDRGRVLRGFIGKVRFPSEKEFKKKENTAEIDFTPYTSYATPRAEEESAGNEVRREAAMEKTEKYRTKIGSTEKQDTYTRAAASITAEDDIKEKASVLPIASETARERRGRSEIYKSAMETQNYFDKKPQPVEAMQKAEMTGTIAPVVHKNETKDSLPQGVTSIGRDKPQPPKVQLPGDINFGELLKSSSPAPAQQKTLPKAAGDEAADDEPDDTEAYEESIDEYEEELKKLDSQAGRLDIG